MRRLLRVAFNTVTVLSLILALLVAELWVRSYWTADDYGWLTMRRSEGVGYMLRLENGRLTIGSHATPNSSWGEFVKDEDTINWHHTWSASPSYRPPQWLPSVWRNSVKSEGTDNITQQTFVLIPAWYVFVLTAALPTVRSVRWYRTRGLLSGHCPACGYDLRAAPDRCPECGAVPTAIEFATIPPCSKGSSPLSPSCCSRHSRSRGAVKATNLPH